MFKFSKRILAISLIFISLLPFSTASAYNDYLYGQSIMLDDIDIDQQYGNYYSDGDNDIETTSEVILLSIDKKNITLEHQGESAFIKVIGICKDKKQIDLTYDVEISSNDNSVVWAYEDRIFAVDKGEATVSVTYGELIETIKVDVKNSVNVEKIFDDAYQLSKQNNSYNLQSTYLTMNQRDTYVTKARNMANMVWSGSSNIRGWRNEYTFIGGFPYTGMPYSQTYYQVDDNMFFQKLNDSSSGFYSDYGYTVENEFVVMPKYGNDCSGFLSFSWGISRHSTLAFVDGIKNGTFPKVGSYNEYSPSYSDLYNSYQYLQAGDAVVRREKIGDKWYAHTFLIIASNNDLCYCYEQTPYYARASFWNWSDLADKHYMPFGMY